MREPAQLVEDLERHPELPPGSEERFYGYAVMGLPFRSGHVLGLRRFPASSIRPALRIWVARGGTATVAGTDLGQIGPATEQVHLRDFAVPQRGVFVIARSFFTAPPT
jgi:hypothetical protein